MATVRQVAWSAEMTFASGRTITLGEGGVVGLPVGSLDDAPPRKRLFIGYDDYLLDRSPGKPLTPAEQIELADYMIAQWTRYKALIQPE